MISNTTNGETSINVANLLLGILVCIVALVLFILYGLPVIRDRNTRNSTQEESEINLQVHIPTGTSSSEGGLYKD